MNNIAEENENQNMNTEQMEKPLETSDAGIEITGEETMEELLDIYESSLKKFEEGQVVTGNCHLCWQGNGSG